MVNVSEKLKSRSMGARPRHILLAALTGVVCALGPVAAAQAEDVGTIAMVGGELTDPFFGALKKGADDAAHDLGFKLNYISASIAAPDLARALQTAVASKPAGIAYGDWFPNAEDPLATQASKSGIPVLALNAAPSNWNSTGAMALVGQSDYDAGVLGGQLLAKAGVTHGICVNHAPGASNIEQRCSGFADAMKKAGGTATVLNLPYGDVNNPGKVSQAIQGAMSSDAKIDGIFTCGSAVAVDAIRAVQQQGVAAKVKVGAIDLSTALLEAIRDGKAVFTIDQQPYLQGYYAVATLAQNAKYGMHLVGQVKTGPLAIDKSTVESVLNVNRKYHGIRGAL